MVSRKINERQLQRERPERRRLPALPPPQRQGRALPIPSPASGPTAAPRRSHRPPRLLLLPPLRSPCLRHAAHPSPPSFPAASLHLAAPPSGFGTRLEERRRRGTGSAPSGQERQPRRSRAELHLDDGTVQTEAPRCVPHAFTELLLATAGGLQPRSVQNTSGVNSHVSPRHLLTAPGPILTGTDVPPYSNASTAKEWLMPKRHPSPPWQAGGSWGSPRPATPGCFLPPGTRGSGAGGGDRSGREEGVPAVAQASRELNMNSRAV